MKKICFMLACLATVISAQAQEKISKEEKERRQKNVEAANPFSKLGSKAKVATLSNGKYLEVHDLDSIVTIGSVRLNVHTREIVEFIKLDSLSVDAQPVGDVPSRWMSPDPLAEEFSEWSPYTFVFNSPIKYNDPTGMAPEECCPELVAAAKGVYDSVKSEVVDTYNFVTSDAYKADTWKGVGNLLLGGAAASGPGGSVANAFALDAELGTNSAGALAGYTQAMDGFYGDLTSGDTQRTAAAVTTLALAVTPSKLDDVAKISKLDNVSKVKSIAEQASDLKKVNNGKNSVTIKTVNGQGRYDLEGKAHAGVETPHKQTYKNNRVNGEVKSVTRTSKTAEPMTQQDIRIVRKTLEKRK